MAQDQIARPTPTLASRGESVGFALRTLKNLRRIETAYTDDDDVHVVTQRVLSFLGVVVFPWMEGFEQNIKNLRLEGLGQKGWPRWDIFLGESKTLGDLLGHLRNAVAHRRLQFSSDSPDPSNVSIEFEDRRRGKHRPNWGARISADDLKLFLEKFMELVVDTID